MQLFNGNVAEKFFNDCVVKLKLNDIDKKINSLTSELVGVKEIDIRQNIAQQISTLLKRKEKIKNGAQ
jgi:hypothetical protein